MPGLSLITSNQLETLIDRLAESIVSPPIVNPMVPEIIAVQSQGMARWISLELARRHGISANYEFPFPNALIEKVAADVLNDGHSEPGYDPEIMAWQIMKLLRKMQNNPEFGAVRAYLEKDRNELKLYQLSCRIANLFDQYTIYRPEMILDWNTHKVDHWQAILWKNLIESAGVIDRATQLKNLLDKIESEDISDSKLPQRISIFGIPSLPPVYIKLFEALSRLVDINIFVMNPCREYWGDILSDKESERVSRKTGKGEKRPQELYIEKGNSLLASMGSMGRDFFELLTEYGGTSSYADPGRQTMLSAIQSDILNLTEHSLNNLPKLKIPVDDSSIMIHSCHSPMREVEVLYDNLLAMFDADPELTPKDIIVMTPEIGTYAPYIKAVFESAESDKKRIPFTIADRDFRTENPVIHMLIAILDLYGSRFEASEVMAILESPVVYPRFSISLSELDLVAEWLKKVNIRWGIDENHKTDLGLPPYYENTWRFGLNRLLLGYALPSDGGELYKNILPYDDIESEIARTLGKFTEFMEQLFRFTAVLGQPEILSDWASLLNEICDAFFVADDDTERELQLLRAAFADLADIGNLSGYGEKISLDIVRQYLKDRFAGHGAGSGFIAGAVTFCAMLPMRSIPFKVICLIGMNNDSFPRQAEPLSFDLIASNPRPGDRSVRNTDRYLFLEAILSTRQKLYLSYTGQSIQDNSPIPPSVVVSELIDYLNRNFSADDRNIIDRIMVKDRLQAFSPEYFKTETSLISYSSENCEAARALLRKSDILPPFLPGRLPEINNGTRAVDVESLCRFFANPCKYLLNNRLGIYLDEIDFMLEDEEPFAVTGLEKYLLEDELLRNHLKGIDIDKRYAIIKASGNLPHGIIGETIYKNAASDVRKFAGKIKPYLDSEKLPSCEIDIKIDDYSITGIIDNKYAAGLIQYRPASIKAKDLLNIWIKHLVQSLDSKPSYPKNSILIGTDMICTFEPVADAEDKLSGLLKLLEDGLTRPLPLFPGSSLKYASDINSGKEVWKAISSARFAWTGSDHSRGESEDPYYRLCFDGRDPIDDEFQKIALSVFEPILNNGKFQK